jgi:hypothetical protein
MASAFSALKLTLSFAREAVNFAYRKFNHPTVWAMLRRKISLV